MKKLLLSLVTALTLTFGASAAVNPDAQTITVADFLAKADTETTYQLTGVVSNIANTLYGNFDLVDETGSIYIYGLLNADGESKKFAEMDIAEGDTLTLQGCYMEYNGKPEIKNAQYVSHVKAQSETVDPDPEQPADVEAITVADFLAKADTETTYQLTGVVSNIANTLYGNFDLVDETGSIYIYGLLNADGEAKKFSEMDIAEGDTLTLQGSYYEYNGKAEIKNAQYISHVKAQGGSVEPDPEVTPDTPVDGNYFVNGGFESWTNGTPDNWKSASSASSATLTQSADARTGNSSVIIEGADKNKRLAYKELVLAAGTYTFSFYAKADAGNEVAEVRPGYAPWKEDGTLDNYVYSDYVKVENDDEWSLVQFVFTLSEVTKLNMVVMNPKNCGNVMVDDAVLEEGDKSTAIRVVATERAIDPSVDQVYNICGKRVFDMSKKGIYIVNGKKYIVR